MSECKVEVHFIHWDKKKRCLCTSPPSRNSPTLPVVNTLKPAQFTPSDVLGVSNQLEGIKSLLVEKKYFYISYHNL